MFNYGFPTHIVPLVWPSPGNWLFPQRGAGLPPDVIVGPRIRIIGTDGNFIPQEEQDIANEIDDIWNDFLKKLHDKDVIGPDRMPGYLPPEKLPEIPEQPPLDFFIDENGNKVNVITPKPAPPETPVEIIRPEPEDPNWGLDPSEITILGGGSIGSQILGGISTGTSIFVSLYGGFTIGANLGCSYRRSKIKDAYDTASYMYMQMKNQLDDLKKKYNKLCGPKPLGNSGQYQKNTDCPDECNDLKLFIDDLNIDLFRINQNLQCINDALQNMNCSNPLSIAANNLWAERAENCGINMIDNMKDFDNLMNAAKSIANKIKRGDCDPDAKPRKHRSYLNT